MKRKKLNRKITNSSSKRFSYKGSFSNPKIKKITFDSILQNKNYEFSEKFDYHANGVVNSAHEYFSFQDKAIKSLEEFKKHFIRLNYNLSLQKYMEEHKKFPTKEYKKQLYKNIESDFNNQFKKNGKEILAPFKKSR